MRFLNFGTSGNTDVIHLEKKSKVSGLCNKQSVSLTREQAQAIVDDRTERNSSGFGVALVA